jgi:S1-C subfamily serine protease
MIELHNVHFVRRGINDELAVVPGSPADKAGIEENDIVLSVNDEEVNALHDFGYLLRLHAPGDTVELGVLHDGETFSYRVTLEERLFE